MSDEADTQEVTEAPASESGGDWRSSLPEQFQDAPFFKDAKDPEDVVNQIKYAADHLGNSIRIPSEEAGAEDRQKFYDKLLEKDPNLMVRPTEDNMETFFKSLGRPDEPNGYKYEGDELPSDFDNFAAIAHENGLSQSQFKGILDKVIEQQSEAQDRIQAEHEAEMKNLNRDWGMAYEQNLTEVKNFLMLTDAPSGVVELIANGAMSADEIRWLHSVATNVKSKPELATQETEQQRALTPDEARERISEMLRNADSPYWDGTHPDHQRYVQRMVEYQKAVGG